MFSAFNIYHLVYLLTLFPLKWTISFFFLPFLLHDSTLEGIRLTSLNNSSVCTWASKFFAWYSYNSLRYRHIFNHFIFCFLKRRHVCIIYQVGIELARNWVIRIWKKKRFFNNWRIYFFHLPRIPDVGGPDPVWQRMTVPATQVSSVFPRRLPWHVVFICKNIVLWL